MAGRLTPEVAAAGRSFVASTRGQVFFRAAGGMLRRGAQIAATGTVTLAVEAST